MKLSKAKEIAQYYLEMLQPYCKKIMIAGSIRREKPEVKDIEIVLVRDTSELVDFVAMVNSLVKIKGTPLGKYTRRKLVEGIYLDIFMTDKAGWIPQLVIRTGSRDFVHKMMIQLNENGYNQRDGYLWKNGKKIICETELEYFQYAGMRHLKPEDRDFPGGSEL